MPDAKWSIAGIAEGAKELMVGMRCFPGSRDERFEIENSVATGKRLTVAKGDRSGVWGRRIGEVEFIEDFVRVLWGEALKFFEGRTARGTQCLAGWRELPFNGMMARTSQGQGDQGCDDVVPQGPPGLTEDDAARSVARIGTSQLRNSVTGDRGDSIVDFVEPGARIHGRDSFLEAGGNAVVMSG